VHPRRANTDLPYNAQHPLIYICYPSASEWGTLLQGTAAHPQAAGCHLITWPSNSLLVPPASPTAVLAACPILQTPYWACTLPNNKFTGRKHLADLHSLHTTTLSVAAPVSTGHALNSTRARRRPSQEARAPLNNMLSLCASIHSPTLYTLPCTRPPLEVHLLWLRRHFLAQLLMMHPYQAWKFTPWRWASDDITPPPQHKPLGAPTTLLPQKVQPAHGMCSSPMTHANMPPLLPANNVNGPPHQPHA
jgi:hypothetical protein